MHPIFSISVVIPTLNESEQIRKLINYLVSIDENLEITILRYRIDTSARRWLKEGRLKNVVRNWILQIAWKLGVSARNLTKWYKFE